MRNSEFGMIYCLTKSFLLLILSGNCRDIVYFTDYLNSEFRIPYFEFSHKKG